MDSPFALLSLIVAVPFLGMLFVLSSKDNEDSQPGRNAFNVCVFTIVSNIILIWRIFMILNENSASLQLIEKFDWLSIPDINIVFGVDVFSLLLILSVHLAVLIGVLGVRSNTYRPKSLLVFTLLFLSMLTGFLVSADIFSFYIFFEAMLFPLFMIIGMFGEVRKQGLINRFFLYNFIGAIILFSATMILFYQGGSLMLADVGKLRLGNPLKYFVWGAVCLSFVSRIPIWPFHYWISSINSGIRNPLAFIITALLPLTSIYGFIRFLPSKLPLELETYIMYGEIIAVVTMLFIALIGFINRDYQYKIFSYVTVYYILYLLGIFVNDELVKTSIGYSLFGFLIIMASLETVSSYIYHKEQEASCISNGFLCRVKRLSFIYSFLTIAAVGMPVSAVFINNFLILSWLLSFNVKMGVLLILSLAFVGVTLLQELLRLKQDSKECRLGKNDDISKAFFAFMLFVIFILLMSFVKPLWFVASE